MAQEIKFVENEADKNELYGEFYLDFNEDETEIISAVLLIDNKTLEIKEKRVIKEYFTKGFDEYLETETIDMEVDFNKLVELLTENEKGEDMSRNYFHH